MTPERWQQIDRLFHSVLACPSRDRAAFLRQACEGDEFLRVEVESLIESHEQPDSFIDSPADDVAAELLSFVDTKLNPGQQIGHYTISSLLGTGGMGEVYLAKDLALGREIALKLLPAEFMGQRERVRRFEQEARAASALNHPNIVTIYEVGRTDSSHFIATEFVDGKTLRQHIAEVASRHLDGGTTESRMEINEVLDIASQIASALAAAHTAGIVHRDIKPENIMLRSDGFVKVLDFGLAKLSFQQTTDPSVNNSERIGTIVKTNPGMVMGTVQYMSPEQARGLEVDLRTDIWSLGVVLYEMVTGRVPFSGETSSHVIVSILEHEPPPVSDYINAPGELTRIISKALNKDRNQRYQKAKDFVSDLKRLKQEFEVNDRLQWAYQEEPKSGESASSRGESSVTLSHHSSNAPTLPLEPARQTSRVEYLDARLSDHKKATGIFLAVFLAVLTMLGLFTVSRLNRSSSKAVTPFQTVNLIKLTNTGKVKDAVISPDGRYVAYVAEERGREGIWVRQMSSSDSVEIVPPGEIQYYGGTFSRDSNHIYYIAKERNNTIGVLYRVPAMGGVSVKLVVDVDGPISLSPDGSQLAFVRGSSSGERALMLANSDGTDERKLATRTGYESISFGGPAWSPDGNRIACGVAYADGSGTYLNIVAVSVTDGSITPLTNRKWKKIGRLWWLADGNGLVFTATDIGQSFTSQLWYLSPNGVAERISQDLQDYHGVSLTSDSGTLVSKQTQTISSLWIAPNDEADRAEEILSHKEDNAFYYYYRTRFSWMADGQIIYTSLVNGTPSIWVMSAQGTGKKQLTSNPYGNSFPSVTPDLRYVVFVSDRTGFTNLWRMDRDGGNEKQLTSGEDDSWAWCSPDSRWMVYHSGIQGKRTLWKLSIDGGSPEQLTDYPSVCPVVSPDGKWISCYYRPETKAPWKLGIIPFGGGPPVKSFDVPQNVLFQSLVRWTPDGRGLAYIKSHDGISNVWVQPLDGNPAKQLTDFKTDQIFWFDWSPDGRQLGVSRGAVTSDVVLMKDVHLVSDK